MANLAQKYRPSAFDDVVEQGLVVTMLQKLCEDPNMTIRNFLLIGPAGTGKTTLGRIMSTTINHGLGNPVELDAASHGGIEDIKSIITQSRTYPIGCDYKCMIIDECVTGDVEILTDHGFKRFDKCDGSEIVAQYNNGNIEFVKPDSWVKNHYVGDMIRWSPRSWCSISMTPNHVQPLYFAKSGLVREQYIKDVKFSQASNIIVSGHGVGVKSSLTYMDRLAIACQADATIQHISKDYIHWSIALSKNRKIDRLLWIFDEGNIQYSEIKPSRGKRRFTFDTPLSITKKLSSHFNLNMNYDCARDFIDEVVLWDGYVTDDYVEYMSTDKDNSDFVSSVAVLGGYSARQRVQVDNRNHAYKDIHKVFLYDRLYSNCQHVKKTVHSEHYDGTVYCVKVPSHMIVVRSQGFVFVTGNCHSLSSTSWQALLKTLEESPAKSIFIFCTTNPEKIPATILSRVQTFQLSKISVDGITNRLKYVIECENKEGRNITYTDDAVGYIAKLSGGGLRDALTLLDKALAYSENITSETLMESLNLPEYDDYFSLLASYAKHDNEAITKLINKVYNSGVNFIKWFEGFHSFVTNVTKYIFIQDITSTMIPAHYADKVSKYGVKHSVICMKLSNRLLKLIADLKTTSYLQEVALTYLLSVPQVPKKENTNA